jgi:hypothetical protein
VSHQRLAEAVEVSAAVVTAADVVDLTAGAIISRIARIASRFTTHVACHHDLSLHFRLQFPDSAFS